MLANGKQFLPLIIYPPCYSYVQLSSVKVGTVIEDIGVIFCLDLNRCRYSILITHCVLFKSISLLFDMLMRDLLKIGQIQKSYPLKIKKILILSHLANYNVTVTLISLSCDPIRFDLLISSLAILHTIYSTFVATIGQDYFFKDY